MARTAKKSQTRKPISEKSLGTKKAALAAEKEHRLREEEAALAASQQRRAQRECELKREADNRLKALKAAQDLLAVNTEKPDPPPAGEATTRKHNRRFNKQNQVQREAIEERNMFVQLAPEKTVRGAGKDEAVECNRCFRMLFVSFVCSFTINLIPTSHAGHILGFPETVTVAYRQMQPRSFLPPLRTKMMDRDIGTSEDLLAKKYKKRVRRKLVATWYHLKCLSPG
ncbi:hypothetical protein EDD18DRAFT_1156565 [Armillaria luteobubalina]|uniref:Uncharacterized protein n=1 Tax=Armillaria luteobubalina TaxID=153913 RepID=A0AA39Q8D4_9AGAR|nr:hypothetical protein EDD18DRAFT_1156565 [Armillaria luteobubalina]